MDIVDEVEKGRACYARRAWLDAHASLSQADQAMPLRPEDLELLATAAYMLGRDDDYLNVLERAHHAHLDGGEVLPAARCAFWIGMTLILRGSMGPATGWLGRSQRLVEREGRKCVEQGYLLFPPFFQQEAAGQYEAAAATAAEAAEIGERFGDADLVALARHEQGLMLINAGRAAEGLGLLDEAMVAVTAGELSPIVSGLVYCSVIVGCQDAYELRRAQEWTAALTRWCEEQPDMVAFTGRCLVHRAEVMQLRGAWHDALEEARQAAGRQGMSQAGLGEAFYLQGDVLRLQGEFAAAEDAYRDASGLGREPQPGLALLRLAQGRRDVAAAAIRRATGETPEPMRRAGLLPAYVEIMLATGDLDDARAACDELQEIAAGYEGGLLGAMAMHARGAVGLASGDSRAGLVALRRASQIWQELEAPYESARVRVLVGLACRDLGDDDTAALELKVARLAFEQLGAAPDLARVDRLSQPPARKAAGGLTAREIEVLRLVAAGKTNKAVAAELVLSEKTVARHVSNIFAKLRVTSRAAATAYAYEHELV